MRRFAVPVTLTAATVLRFPIPMRGNEIRPRRVLLRKPRLFPIPKIRPRRVLPETGLFPIPMRGNETTPSLSATRGCCVPDPHEG